MRERILKSLILCLALCFAKPYLLDAQVFWLSSEIDSSGQVTWLDKVNGQTFHTSNSPTLLNFHPTLKIDSKIIQFPIINRSLAQCQIFTVFRSNPHSREQLLWSLKDAEKDRLILTDFRAVDFTKASFMNFIDYKPGQKQINTYRHYRKTYDVDEIQIGGLPANPELPLTNYKGELAEMIIFDKMLAPMASQYIESILSLKYSIPLKAGVDYLQKDGQKIWDGARGVPYSFNITGIGRDDQLNFYQKQSETLFGDGSIVLGLDDIFSSNSLNKSLIDENCFFIWGDNEENIEFDNSLQGQNQLRRIWRIQQKGDFSNHAFKSMLRSCYLTEKIGPEARLWMIIDTMGKDDFKMWDCRYIPFEEDVNGFFKDNIHFGRAKIQYFTFLSQPDFWASMEVEKAICNPATKGAVAMRILGGSPPYKMTMVKKEPNPISESREIKGEYVELDGLDGGRYTVTLIDAENRSWSKSFHIQYQDIQEPEFPAVINKIDGNTQYIDASIGMPLDVSYSWETPNGDKVENSIIEIGETGKYQLEYKSNGCESSKDMLVEGHRNVISKMSISPNPSINGYFKLIARLEYPSQAKLRIYDVEGKLWFEKDYDTTEFIDDYGRLDQAGIYMVTLEASEETVSKKLIVQPY